MSKGQLSKCKIVGTCIFMMVGIWKYERSIIEMKVEYVTEMSMAARQRQFIFYYHRGAARQRQLPKK